MAIFISIESFLAFQSECYKCIFVRYFSIKHFPWTKTSSSPFFVNLNLPQNGEGFPLDICGNPLRFNVYFPLDKNIKKNKLHKVKKTKFHHKQ